MLVCVTFSNKWSRCEDITLATRMEGCNRLESFDFEVDNWDAYRERLEQLFHINGHAGSEEADLARRRAALFTVCGKNL